MTDQPQHKWQPYVEIQPNEHLPVETHPLPPHLVDTELHAVCICQQYVLIAQKTDLNCFVFGKNSTFSINTKHRISSIHRIECANSKAGV